MHLPNRLLNRQGVADEVPHLQTEEFARTKTAGREQDEDNTCLPSASAMILVFPPGRVSIVTPLLGVELREGWRRLKQGMTVSGS